MKARGFGLLVVLVVSIGCDQATKHLASTRLAGQPPHSFLRDTVRLVYATNSGAFLSLGANLPPRVRFWGFQVFAGLMALVPLAYALLGRLGPSQRIACAFLCGGGLSNWIDRVRNGVVVDFLNLGLGSVRTGIFNVADVAVVLGVALLLINTTPAARVRA